MDLALLLVVFGAVSRGGGVGGWARPHPRSVPGAGCAHLAPGRCGAGLRTHPRPRQGARTAGASRALPSWGDPPPRSYAIEKPHKADTKTVDIVRGGRLHCKVSCLTHYLLYLDEEGTTEVANAFHVGVVLTALCADVVERLNTIIKYTCQNATTHGGAGGGVGGNSTKTGGTCGFARCGVGVFEASSSP